MNEGPQPGQRADLLRRLRCYNLLLDAEDASDKDGQAPAHSVAQLRDLAVTLLAAVASVYDRYFDSVDDAIIFLERLDA